MSAPAPTSPAASAAALDVETVVIGPFAANAHVVVDRASGAAAIVDTGDSGRGIATVVKRLGVTPSMVLLTHGHLDHAGGLAEVRRHWPGIPIHLHPKDRPMVEAMTMQGRFFGLQIEAAPPIDHELREGQEIALGNARFRVIEAPGHSPGSVIFYEERAGIALSGDVIFRGGIGRTDLPGGDSDTLFRTLTERVLGLPDATRLLVGHGEETTVGRERRSNPFLSPGAAGLFDLA